MHDVLAIYVVELKTCKEHSNIYLNLQRYPIDITSKIKCPKTHISENLQSISIYFVSHICYCDLIKY